MIQASSQLNPDRDRTFQFSGQQLPISKFGQDNLPKIFRFGTHQELSPTRHISQDCAGENPAPSHFSTFTSLGIPFCNKLFHSSSDLVRSSPHMNLKLTYLPLQINGKIWALLHFHFLVIVEAPMLARFGTVRNLPQLRTQVPISGEILASLSSNTLVLGTAKMILLTAHPPSWSNSLVPY